MLSLFVVEQEARSLHARVSPQVEVPSGFLFDRGDLVYWGLRARATMT